MEKYNFNRKNNGITLIALVVTIIVLLIIAGISISMLLGNNGIINKAIQSKDEYSKEEVKEKVSLAINEYTIENSTKENIGFDKFLRKNLNVVVGKNTDNTYSFMLGEYQVTINENRIVNIEKFNLNVDKTFSSVDDMKAAQDLENGELIKTEGYYDKKYGGSAYYDIVDNTELDIDNSRCIALNNGKYAKIHAINDTITVNQFGAYGDGIHDDSSAIKKAINSNFSNISFESEKYKINSRININTDNKYLIGNNSEIFYDDDFVFADDFIVGVFKANNQIINNVSIDGLKIINKNSTRTDEHLMLQIINAENIDITNCKIEATTDESNKNRRVTNMYLRKYWKNINIDSCELINTTLAPAGKTIFIRAGQDGTGNLNFTNNKIKKSSHDSTIDIFGAGTVKNVKISNNTIDFDDTNVESKSPYSVMSFGTYDAQINDMEFSDNNIKAIACSNFFHCDNVSNMIIKNNTFELTSLSTDVGAGYINGTKKTFDVSFENNKVDLIGNNPNSEIFSLIPSIKNNVINVRTSFVLLFQKCNDLSNNTVTLYNELNRYSSIFAIRDTNLDKDVNVINNKFVFDTTLKQESRLINLYRSYINGKKVTINNNIVLSNQNQTAKDQFAVYFQTMKDTNPQKIYMKNNSLGFYSNNIGKYDNLTDYSIVEE